MLLGLFVASRAYQSSPPGSDSFFVLALSSTFKLKLPRGFVTDTFTIGFSVLFFWEGGVQDKVSR